MLVTAKNGPDITIRFVVQRTGIITMSDMTPLIPRQRVPNLSLQLVGGDAWSIASDPQENFTLLVFYHGMHCPLCRMQLKELQSRLFDFSRLGVSVVAISTDNVERATSTKQDWGLDRLTIAYGFGIKQARQWGLYVSTTNGTTSIGIEEPRMFNEPGLFLVKPDQTLYYVAVQSVPFARPAIDDILKAIEFVLQKNYPARGEVVSV